MNEVEILYKRDWLLIERAASILMFTLVLSLLFSSIPKLEQLTISAPVSGKSKAANNGENHKKKSSTETAELELELEDQLFRFALPFTFRPIYFSKITSNSTLGLFSHPGYTESIYRPPQLT